MAIRDGQYPKRKDWRRTYRKSKAFDASCRCHGSCSWCRQNRLHADTLRRTAAEEQIREYVEGT